MKWKYVALGVAVAAAGVALIRFNYYHSGISGLGSDTSSVKSFSDSSST